MIVCKEFTTGEVEIKTGGDGDEIGFVMEGFGSVFTTGIFIATGKKI